MAYWALDTWRSNNNNQVRKRNYWPEFYANNLIAIGWGDINIPLKPKNKEIREALKKEALINSEYDYYLTHNEARAAKTIFDFIYLSEVDNILICEGYSYNSNKVHLYGTAKVTESYRKDKVDDWRCFLHKADIQQFKEDRRYIPKSLLEEMLDGKGAFRGTLRKMKEEQYNRVEEWVKR